MQIRRQQAAQSRRGNALILMLLVTVMMVGLAGAALNITTSSVREVEAEKNQIQALYAAEAAIGAGLHQLAVSYQTRAAVASNVGTLANPIALDSDQYWTTLEANADGTYTIRATGISGRASRTVEAIAEALPASPFEHSVFAGNLSEDPAYQLTFGGREGQADEVSGGEVYSGGDIVVNDDASIRGKLRAHGDVIGETGQGGVIMDVPQVLSIDYEQFNDYNVSTLFESAPRLEDNAGGTAGQLPSTSPAHFFRKNPSDRTSDTDATTKDDYFLEDPYETVQVDRDQDGSDAFDLSIPGEANNRVFFIDGNLWIHNRKSYSFKITNPTSNPTRITFVVKGNVYFSDNLFYDDPTMDGVAFMALADPDVPDSGNVYFGDPVFGTMRFAESLMFAENNFYDTNLDAAGSSQVKIRGNMTAGNQIAIKRDFVREDGGISHTKLDLVFDRRQADGLLNMPGVPVAADHPTGYSIVTWREIDVPRQFAVATPTITVDSPPVASPTDDPFSDTMDPFSTDALNSHDWRKRWTAKYGSDWKKELRQSHWDSSTVLTGGY